ncbi:MAG: DUF1059 domain-containing protein [Halioglobus sp.]
MKTMTCKQLGGACALEFRAETFEEMAKLSQEHGMEMHQQKDAAHLEAMNAMSELMKNPGEMEAWFEAKKAEFNALEES